MTSCSPVTSNKQESFIAIPMLTVLLNLPTLSHFTRTLHMYSFYYRHSYAIQLPNAQLNQDFHSFGNFTSMQEDDRSNFLPAPHQWICSCPWFLNCQTLSLSPTQCRPERRARGWCFYVAAPHSHIIFYCYHFSTILLPHETHTSHRKDKSY